MKSHAQTTIRDDAKALVERLRAEGRFTDATILRRLVLSHMGQANQLVDYQRLRTGLSATAQTLRATLATQAQP